MGIEKRACCIKVLNHATQPEESHRYVAAANVTEVWRNGAILDFPHRRPEAVRYIASSIGTSRKLCRGRIFWWVRSSRMGEAGMRGGGELRGSDDLPVQGAPSENEAQLKTLSTLLS